MSWASAHLLCASPLQAHRHALLVASKHTTRKHFSPLQGCLWLEIILTGCL